MEEKYNLYYDNELILYEGTREEFMFFLNELHLDYGYEPNGDYIYFYNNHYWYEILS